MEQEPLAQTQPRRFNFPREFVVPIILIIFLLFSALGYYLYSDRTRIFTSDEHQTCPALDPIAGKFADSQRKYENGRIVYAFSGNLVADESRNGSIDYKYDFGKGIWSGPPETINVPTHVLPKEYLGKKEVKSVTDLAIPADKLPARSSLTLVFRDDKPTFLRKLLNAYKPCKLVEWKLVSEATPVAPQKLETADYQSIAQKVLFWLGKQKDERGIYLNGQTCRVNGQCESQPIDSRVGVNVVWGRYQFYKVQPSQEDLDLMRKDLNILSDTSKTKVIQPTFWHCRSLFEMSNDNAFTQSDKDKIKLLCEWAMYPDAPQTDLSSAKTTQDLIKIVAAKSSPEEKYLPLSELGANLSKNAAYASDMATRYLWYGSTKDLERAQLFFSYALGRYEEAKSDKYLAGRCLLGVAATDLYKATKDKNYLDFAEKFFDKEKFDVINPSYFADNLEEQVECNIFARELYSLTKLKRDQEFSQKLTKGAIDRAYDSPGLPGYFVGDHAFNNLSRGSDMNGANVRKSVQTNALMVVILTTVK